VSTARYSNESVDDALVTLIEQILSNEQSIRNLGRGQ
jgi:hypothetical protein